MLEREQHGEYISENYYNTIRYREWVKLIARLLRNQPVIRFALFGTLFLLICAVDFLIWVQLPLLAIVFGVLMYLQLEYKDRNAPHIHTRMMIGTKYVIHVKEVCAKAYTDETQKL